MHSIDDHKFTSEETSQFREALLKWYDVEKRSLPWRVSFNPEWTDDEKAQRAYEVWVSEIMLQQTQVSTVIPYYANWMNKWPTIHDLAKADIEDVKQVWAGLGYYSRASRLLEGAKSVVEKLNGRLPTTAESLVKEISGIGPYTGGIVIL